MTTHDRVRLQLQALEALLREHQHWRNDEPQPHQFNSTQPFFMDTMEPLEWLQWVLIPRMHDLLDNKQPLPGAFASHPIMKWRWRRTTRNARLFWLSWKNWMLFLRMMRANAGNTLSG